MEIAVEMALTALAAMYQEANGASENKEALVQLSNRASDLIKPQLLHCQSLKCINEQYVKNAFDNLRVVIEQVTCLIQKRGKPRSGMVNTFRL